MSKKTNTHELKKTSLQKVKNQSRQGKKEKDLKKPKKQLRPNSHASILKEIQSLQQRIEQECQESSSTLPSVSQAKERQVNETAGATCFEELPLSNRTLRALKLSNFKHLTPIQKECIPLGLLGFDILGEAETGSGKTLAFLIPVLENLYRHIWEKHDGLGSLIITPTRELAAQIFDVLQSVGRFHTFSAICVIGGKNIQHEQGRVQDMNLVIATPGRLLHHLEESPLFDAGQLKMLVIDEADMLLDMGFSDTINQILQHLPDSSTRQTFLFSATLSVAVHRLALLSLKDTAKKVTVRPSGIVPPKERLKQYFIVLQLDQQLNVFFSILKHRAQKKIIVFVNSCKQVRYIYEVFWRLKPGCALFELHGRQNQQKRLDMLGKFSLKPTAACLICTDIGARGIDFPSVDVVIQLNCPPDIATYVHRIGRTARYNECGMSILCLLNSERLFLDRLKEQKIHPQQMFLRPEKLHCLNKKLSSILAENPSLKYLAQRYVVSYLRSVHLSRDKGVFSYSQCIGGSDGLQKFAYSLGLVSLPPDVLDMVSIPEKKKKLSKLERFKLKIQEKKKSTEESCSKIMSKKEKKLQRLRQLRESGTSPCSDDQAAEKTYPEEDSILIPVKSPKPSTSPRPVLSHGTIAKKLKVDNIRIKADGTTKIKGLAMLTSKRPDDENHHVLFDEQEDGTIQPQTMFESLVKELNQNALKDDHDENPETYLATLRQTLSQNEEADKQRDRERVHKLHATKRQKKSQSAPHDLESTASCLSSSDHCHDKDSPHDLTQLEEDALNVLHPLLCTIPVPLYSGDVMSSLGLLEDFTKSHSAV